MENDRRIEINFLKKVNLGHDEHSNVISGKKTPLCQEALASSPHYHLDWLILWFIMIIGNIKGIGMAFYLPIRYLHIILQCLSQSITKIIYKCLFLKDLILSKNKDMGQHVIAMNFP